MHHSIKSSLFKKIFIALSLVIGVSAGYTTPAFAATYYVDPSAGVNGTGTLASPFNTWAFGSFAANNTYLQKSGTTYNGYITISSLTSASTTPLQLGKYGTGSAPLINGSISVDNSSYVTISDLAIASSTYSGVGIMNGSNHVIVQRNAITNTGAGVWIGNNAGMNNQILSNYIFNNKTHGIAVDRVNCTAGNETYIQGNLVFSNYTHGIELTGNYYIVQSNVVYGNGAVNSGASGIHVFSISTTTPGTYGAYNTIRYNVSYNNYEPSAYDGNGIELDLATGYNQVYQNLTFGNDGAGIIVFDSTNNNVHDNVVLNNLIDTSHTHVPQYKGEIVLGASSNLPILDLTQNTTLSSNTVISTKTGIAAIAVDTLTSNNPMSVGSSTFYNSQGGNFYAWATTTGNNLLTWNNTLVPGGGDDSKSNVPLTNAQGVSTSTMDFVFAPADQTLSGLINGVSPQFIGWKAATGLYVLYPTPTASLTFNGSRAVTVHAGDTLSSAWSSLNGSTATSTFTENSASCGLAGTGPYPSNFSTLSGTSTSTILSCQSGHTYTYTFQVTNPVGVSTSTTAVVTVL